MTAPAGCGWTADSNDVWITVINTRHTGSAQVAFRVASNQGNASARNGTLTIAGLTFTVMQAGCSFSLTPTGRAVPVGGVQGAPVAVSSPAGCGWTAAANDAWLVITSGQGGGSGNGQVIFTGGAERRQHERSDGHADHRRPDLHREPGRLHVLAGRHGPIGSRERRSGRRRRCGRARRDAAGRWSATTAWITITSGPSGTGNGQVVFSVAPNQATTPRTGTLTIPGRTFTVTQAAGASSP